MKKLIAVMMALTFIISGFASTAYASDTGRQNESKETRAQINGYINAYNVNLRVSPSTSAASLGQVNRGDHLEKLNDNVSADGYIWTKVYMTSGGHKGAIGWVVSDYITWN